MAAALLFCQFPTTFELNGKGEIVKQTRSVGDLATIATACLIGGAALLVYALNGVRLVRVGLGSIVAEGSSAGESASKYYARPPTESVQNIDLPGDPPEPTEAPAKQLTAVDDEVAVFELLDVPVQVVLDALGQWPDSAGRKPGTLADFQFATRKRGKGNHPWTLKFRDCTPVKVSYGGRGKADGTVAEAAQQGAAAAEPQPG
ncbi:hypothetical protein KJ059_18380 [Myxococcota bacterium]|nr:hypothetical protein [Myxococcota bacterium]MCZ7617206.1 hypothetical protein [Myxococcota bacterium]